MPGTVQLTVDECMRAIQCCEILITIIVVQANDMLNLYSNNNADLNSGVIISARKPIAVFAGCDCVSIPDNTDYCEHIMEQVNHL